MPDMYNLNPFIYSYSVELLINPAVGGRYVYILKAKQTADIFALTFVWEDDELFHLSFFYSKLL